MKRRVLPWLMLMLALTVSPAPVVPPARAAAPPLPRGVRYVMLIRHGYYDRDSTLDDRVGNGLNALGREQARRTGERLAALPVKVATLVSSDYRRARETAEIIGHVLGIRPGVDSLLRECAPAGDNARSAENEDCERQLGAAWAAAMRPAGAADLYDVLVCHGNMIRWWVCRSLGIDTRKWRAMDIGNGSLTVLAVRPDSTMRLVTFSDVGHLAPGEQTWTGCGPGWGGTSSMAPGARADSSRR